MPVSNSNYCKAFQSYRDVSAPIRTTCQYQTPITARHSNHTETFPPRYGPLSIIKLQLLQAIPIILRRFRRNSIINSIQLKERETFPAQYDLIASIIFIVPKRPSFLSIIKFLSLQGIPIVIETFRLQTAVSILSRENVHPSSPLSNSKYSNPSHCYMDVFSAVSSINFPPPKRHTICSNSIAVTDPIVHLLLGSLLFLTKTSGEYVQLYCS